MVRKFRIRSQTLILLASLAFTLMACQERSVSYRHNHRGQQAELSPAVKAQVISWESKLVSGQFLVRITHEDFLAFREALFHGVFDPNTTLSSAEIDRIGRDCTTSPSDATIGLRRFERTLTLAPEFLTMTDDDGRYLHDWLVALNRTDLLAIEREAQVKLAVSKFTK